MRSWAGGVQIFTRPLLMRRTALQLVGLGDKNNGGRHTIFRSNEHVRIATEVHQAAQPLLLCNGNAGIQRARKARITAIRPPNALCATAPWISTGSLNSHGGSAIASRIWAFERACANTQSNLSLFASAARLSQATEC